MKLISYRCNICGYNYAEDEALRHLYQLRWNRLTEGREFVVDTDTNLHICRDCLAGLAHFHHKQAP